MPHQTSERRSPVWRGSLPETLSGEEQLKTPSSITAYHTGLNTHTILDGLTMRLRFTIRDLLLATLIVALIAGWWFDHRRLTAWHRGYQFKLWRLQDDGMLGAGVKPDWSDDSVERMYRENLGLMESFEQYQRSAVQQGVFPLPARQSQPTNQPK